MKKGFTIIELLIVVGIIGILMGVLIGAMSGSTDSARAAKCQANFHTVASACQAVAMNTECFPLAGSMELCKISVQRSNSQSRSEAKGWVSWASMGAYRSQPKAHQANGGWFLSTYEKNVDKRVYALTNGAIWQAISGNAAAYVCPHHRKCVSHRKVDPIWSYVMNSYFGWDESRGGDASYGSSPALGFKDVKKLDRRLYLAELPFDADNSAQKCSFSTGSGIALDPTLQYEENEYIGFNHKNGKKWYAHVCFADGHVEKLELPKGASEARLRELTKFLCEGKDIFYNGAKYEEMK